MLNAELEQILSVVRPSRTSARVLHLSWQCCMICFFDTRAWGARQTDDMCTDFEKRLKAIVPSAKGVGGTGCGPADSALAACTVAQAQTDSLILAATGALQGCSHLLTAALCPG